MLCHLCAVSALKGVELLVSIRQTIPKNKKNKPLPSQFAQPRAKYQSLIIPHHNTIIEESQALLLNQYSSHNTLLLPSGTIYFVACFFILIIAHSGNLKSPAERALHSSTSKHNTTLSQNNKVGTSLI